MHPIRIATLAAVFASMPIIAAAADDTSQDDIVRDANGTTQYIVQLRSNVESNYPTSLQGASHFPAYHRNQVVNAVLAFERRYKFLATQMTSWSSDSFTAYLNDSLVNELARDPRVESIAADHYVHYSSGLPDAGAVWSDLGDTISEAKSWGKLAINSTTTLSTGGTYVYIVDAGVGQHQDFSTNIVERVNAMDHSHDCGTRTGVGLSACTSTSYPYVVGCYTHSTAIAGIIGAAANGSGVVGINPGVKIVSVAVPQTAGVFDTTNGCVGDPLSGIPTTNFKTALDWVTQDIAVNNPNGLTSVVNLSINWAITSQATTDVSTDMQTLASSTPGAIVIQAGGNDAATSYNHAFRPVGQSGAVVSDGVMVVGAINNHGQPVVPLSEPKDGAHQKYGMWRDSRTFGYQKGSNWGPYIDIWAPGDGILVPVANPSTATHQKGNVVYTTYGFGSGTSFAAPHIAGLASMIIEQQHYTSPGTVEQAVRSLSYDLGSLDSNAPPLHVFMPTANTTHPSPASTPYGEFLAVLKSGTTVTDAIVNGFQFVLNANDYEQTNPHTLVYPTQFADVAFSSKGTPTYGCTVTRSLQPFGTPLFTIINNQTTLAETTPDWSVASGSNPWSVDSACFASGTRITVTAP